MGNLLTLPFPMRTPLPYLSPKFPSVSVFLGCPPYPSKDPFSKITEQGSCSMSSSPRPLKTSKLSPGVHWVRSGLLPMRPPSRVLCKAYLDYRSPLGLQEPTEQPSPFPSLWPLSPALGMLWIRPCLEEDPCPGLAALSLCGGGTRLACLVPSLCELATMHTRAAGPGEAPSSYTGGLAGVLENKAHYITGR